MNEAPPRQSEMSGVVPPRTELQNMALTLSEAEVTLDIARDRYKKLEEQLQVAMINQKADRVIVRDSMNYDHTYTHEVKESLRHKKKIARTLVKSNDDEPQSPE